MSRAFADVAASPDKTQTYASRCVYQPLAHDTKHGRAAEPGSLDERHRKMKLDLGRS